MNMTESLINNSKGVPGDPATGDGKFWEDNDRTLLNAIIYYLWTEGEQPEDKSLPRVADLLAFMHIDNDGDISPADLVFQELNNEKPGHVAARLYFAAMSGPAKTRNCVIMSCSTRLNLFHFENVRQMFCCGDDDEMELEKLASEDTVIFINVPDNDRKYGYLVGLFYTVVLDTLWYIAEQSPGGKLKKHVTFYMDEFFNTPPPLNFENYISTCRKKSISLWPVVQGIGMLQTMFPKNRWQNIIANTSIIIYLGNFESISWEWFSKALGRETINQVGMNKSVRSTSSNYSSLGRELLTPDEVKTEISGNKCLVLIANEKSCIDNKYNIRKHKYYKKTTLGGADPYVFSRADYLKERTSAANLPQPRREAQSQ